MITINSYSFAVDGLAISYTSKGTTSLIYDHKSTADLFLHMGWIEGFDINYQTGEPVILFEREHDYEDEEGNVHWTTRTGFCTWADFVASFLFTQRHGEMIAELLEAKKASTKFIQKINYLLEPLAA